MVTFNERNEKFYTEAGLAALKARLNSLKNIHNRNRFPFNAQAFGFGSLQISCQAECLARIRELCELTGEQVKVETRTSKNEEGKKIMEIQVL